MTQEDYVVLVNEQDEVVGTMPKRLVHRKDTPLHRGVSLFVFNEKGEVLTQRRAFSKRISPGLWTDSCSAHPLPGESNVESARRRLQEEMGLEATEIVEVAPYRYYVDHEGVLENEICPVLVGKAAGEPVIDSIEVADARWVPWSDFVTEVRTMSYLYTPWCIDEVEIILGTLKSDFPMPIDAFHTRVR